MALQLTNILRDIREDGLMGRVYIPAADLVRHDCTLKLDEHGRFVDEPEALTALLREQAARARGWYDEGLRLLPLLDRRSAACTAAMAGIYSRLLKRIAQQPLSALNARMSLPAWEKAVVAGRALAGVHPRERRASSAAAWRASPPPSRCRRPGSTVELFEQRPRLGGATHSFQRDGVTVDNGQHVMLRAFTAYRGLLDRLGTADGIDLQDRASTSPS